MLAPLIKRLINVTISANAPYMKAVAENTYEIGLGLIPLRSFAFAFVPLLFFPTWIRRNALKICTIFSNFSTSFPVFCTKNQQKHVNFY